MDARRGRSNLHDRINLLPNSFSSIYDARFFASRKLEIQAKEEEGRRKEGAGGVCRGKESNIIQKRRKLFPDAKVSPFYITGERSAERDVSRCSEELHLGDNFSNYYQMANGQSLCFSRADHLPPRGPEGEGPPSPQLQEVSRGEREGDLRAQYRADDKPSSGKSIFDRNAPCFPTTCTRSLRGQGFRTSSGRRGGGTEVEETLQRSH